MLAILAGVASLQVRHWANSESLFRRALAVTSENWVAHDNLADTLSNSGAMSRPRSIPGRRCDWPRVRPPHAQRPGRWRCKTRGSRLRQSSNTGAALKLQPNFAAGHNNLAMILAPQGKVAEAIVHLREAMRLCPEHAEGYINLAWIRATCPDRRFRDGPEAVRLAQEACRLSDRNNARALSVLVDAYGEAGRFGDAAAAAVRRPGSPGNKATKPPQP